MAASDAEIPVEAIAEPKPKRGGDWDDVDGVTKSGAEEELAATDTCDTTGADDEVTLTLGPG